MTGEISRRLLCYPDRLDFQHWRHSELFDAFPHDDNDDDDKMKLQLLLTVIIGKTSFLLVQVISGFCRSLVSPRLLLQVLIL